MVIAWQPVFEYCDAAKPMFPARLAPFLVCSFCLYRACLDQCAQPCRFLLQEFAEVLGTAAGDLQTKLAQPFFDIG
jgi:hypothetical protein